MHFTYIYIICSSKQHMRALAFILKINKLSPEGVILPTPDYTSRILSRFAGPQVLFMHPLNKNFNTVTRSALGIGYRMVNKQAKSLPWYKLHLSRGRPGEKHKSE